MAIDPYLGPTALALAVIFIIGLILHLIRQPHVIAYIIAGVLLGGDQRWVLFQNKNRLSVWAVWA